MDRKSPNSTGLCPLPGPLPKKGEKEGKQGIIQLKETKLDKKRLGSQKKASLKTVLIAFHYKYARFYSKDFWTIFVKLKIGLEAPGASAALRPWRAHTQILVHYLLSRVLWFRLRTELEEV